MGKLCHRGTTSGQTGYLAKSHLPEHHRYGRLPYLQDPGRPDWNGQEQASHCHRDVRHLCQLIHQRDL